MTACVPLQVAFVDLDIKALGKVPGQFALDRAIAEHATRHLEAHDRLNTTVTTDG